MIKLSICIPTYNRGPYIGHLLDSILAQGDTSLEVVISDNASTDNTALIIEEYRHKFAHFTYFRWQENMGADRNFLKVVELATGDYCWLMGSDDALEIGSIDYLKDILNKNIGISGCSINHVAFDSAMANRIHARPVTGGRIVSDKCFNNVDSVFSEIGDYLGYLSGQVVNRREWNFVVDRYNIEPYFNAYIHIYVIARMLQNNPNWIYIHKKLVAWRSGNDSFLAEGRLKRMLIDINGYRKIVNDVFGFGSKPYRALLSTVATVHVRYAILDGKLHKVGLGFTATSLRECLKSYWMLPKFWLKTFPLLITPGFIVRAARSVYRVTIKKYICKRRQKYMCAN